MRWFTPMFKHMVGQRRGNLIKIGDWFKFSTELCQRGWAVTIDKNTQLRGRFIGGIETHPWRGAKGDTSVFNHRDLT